MNKPSELECEEGQREKENFNKRVIPFFPYTSENGPDGGLFCG
jgi:hypothetical protein